MVRFVFREDYYVAARDPKRPIEGDDVKSHAAHEEWAAEMERVFGLAEVIVAKSRHGSTGKVRLHFEAKTTKLRDLADDSRAYGDYEEITSHKRKLGAGSDSRKTGDLTEEREVGEGCGMSGGTWWCEYI